MLDLHPPPSWRSCHSPLPICPSESRIFGQALALHLRIGFFHSSCAKWCFNIKHAVSNFTFLLFSRTQTIAAQQAPGTLPYHHGHRHPLTVSVFRDSTGMNRQITLIVVAHHISSDLLSGTSYSFTRQYDFLSVTQCRLHRTGVLKLWSAEPWEPHDPFHRFCEVETWFAFPPLFFLK